MITQKQINQCTNILKDTFKPSAIYLFGSYVWGTPNEDSDLDYLIILKESNKPYYRRAQDGEKALLGSSIPTDILIPTEKELINRMKLDPHSLYQKILDNGLKL